MRFARLENGDVVPIEYAFDTLKPIRQIGRGGQGVNWLFKRKRDKALLVQKSYNNYKEFSGLPWEVYIMGRVVALHPRILQLEGWHIRKDLTLEIYYPYCEGGDLSQFAPKPGCGQPEAFVWHVFVQLADALASLHHGYDRKRRNPRKPPIVWKPVVHGDIKPKNIFLPKRFNARDECAPLVVADFGSATLDPRTMGGGTPRWHGPEYPSITAKADVWGLGAIIHWLCHGKSPADSPRPKGISAMKWKRMPESKQPQTLRTAYSEELNRSMMDCLRSRPEDRINSVDLVSHVVSGRDKYLRRR